MKLKKISELRSQIRRAEIFRDSVQKVEQLWTELKELVLSE